MEPQNEQDPQTPGGQTQNRESLEDMIRRAQDTIHGLRGNLQQTRAEKQELEQQHEKVVSENETLRAQMQSMMAKINEISEVIPELARRARKADRLEELSKHPQLMTVDPLRELLLEAELPEGKLGVYAEQLASVLDELVIGQEEGSEEPGEPETSPETAESGAEQTPGGNAEGGNETEGSAPGQAQQIPPGPPPMNSSTFDGATTSIQQMIDEAIKAGDLDAVQRLTVEHLMGDVDISLLSEET